MKYNKLIINRGRRCPRLWRAEGLLRIKLRWTKGEYNIMSKKRILLVEDDRFILEMYAEKLNDVGFQVEKAEDGVVAVELAKKKNPDLILLDIIIPKMDGFEVLKALKKEQKLKNVPVILLTNLGQRQSIEKGLKLGATDYIIKAHFTPAEVIEKIEQILKKKE